MSSCQLSATVHELQANKEQPGEGTEVQQKTSSDVSLIFVVDRRRVSLLCPISAFSL